MYYVYILKSQKDGKLYIGSTGNLKQRFKNHKNGQVISTKHRRPLILILYEAFLKKTDALRREKYFKTSKGKSTIKMMLKDSLKTI